MRKWENICLHGKQAHATIKRFEGQADNESKMDLKEISFCPAY